MSINDNINMYIFKKIWKLINNLKVTTNGKHLHKICIKWEEQEILEITENNK